MGNEQSSGTAAATAAAAAPPPPRSKRKQRLLILVEEFSCLAPVYHPNITVVNSGPIAGSGTGSSAANSSVLDDSDLNKLAAIPKFLPILRSSINLQNDPTQIPHLENGPVGINAD